MYDFMLNCDVGADEVRINFNSVLILKYVFV